MKWRRTGKKGYIILALVLVFIYWTTGRMDTKLAGWGLNNTECVQFLGSTYCGDQVKSLQDNFGKAAR